MSRGTLELSRWPIAIGLLLIAVFILFPRGEDDATADEDDDTVVPLEEGAELGDDDEDVTVPTVPPDAAFDDEDDARVVAAVTGEDDDDEDDGIEGLRDGEFVCRSCYMAKRESQLADADRMFCRDCA